MNLSPARKRLFTSALRALRDGRSVVVIAHPSDEAVAVARMLCHLAKKNEIACRNVAGNDAGAPAVRARAYGQTASIDRAMPIRSRPLIVIDQSAAFERGCVRAPRFRTVFA